MARKPRLDGATGGSTPHPYDLTSARSRPPGQLLDADLHQLASNDAPHPGVVLGLPRQRASRVGVHTPEFSFEHQIELVDQAVRAREIDYPVALDNDYTIWNAFDNHYWPAVYLLDKKGTRRGQHFGEGSYEQVERAIQRLLGVERPLVTTHGTGVEAEADWPHLHSPETYLGRARTTNFAPADGSALRRAAPPQPLGSDRAWSVSPEHVLLQQPGGSIAYRFLARDAHLVLSTSDPEPISFRVLLDGAEPGPHHGVDVDEGGSGVLREGRMYQLVRTNGDVRERTLEVTFSRPEVRAHVFTFG